MDIDGRRATGRGTGLTVGRTDRRLRRRVDRAVRDRPPARALPETWPEHPDAVGRYLRFMGAQPGDRGRDLRARFGGSFQKLGLGWMPANAWQFNSADPIERRFVMRIRFRRVVPMIAVDTYRDGHGEMVGTVGGVRVAHGRGEPFDLGELVTWLNDAVLLAPGQLFDAGAALTEVDERCFEAAVSAGGLTASASVELGADGAPVLFTTRDRYADLPGGPTRATWQTPVTAWGRTADGRAVPTAAEATWLLPDGPLTYVRGGFDPASIELRAADGA